jgi:ATP-dependent DNA ligase
MPSTLTISPCLCREYDQPDTGNLVVEAKVDGIRCVVYVGESVQAFTRNGNPIELTEQTQAAVRAVGHPVLDGELYNDCFVAFDLPTLAGSWRIRREELQRAVRKLRGTKGIALVPVIHDPVIRGGLAVGIYDALGVATMMGFEGIVLKDPNQNYIEGQRAWAKVKPICTEDLRVIDLLDNGSLVVNRQGVRVTVGMGLTQSMRNSAASMLGRLIEVQFQEVTTRGSLRHPVFLRTRDDKDESN